MQFSAVPCYLVALTSLINTLLLLLMAGSAVMKSTLDYAVVWTKEESISGIAERFCSSSKYTVRIGGLHTLPCSG